MKKLKENNITSKKENVVKYNIVNKIINSGNIFLKELEKYIKPFFIFDLLILYSNADSIKMHVNN